MLIKKHRKYIPLIIAAVMASSPAIASASVTQLEGAEVPSKYQKDYEITNCIDVSAWQGNIAEDDWISVKDQGIDSVIIRIGFSSYKDFKQHKDRYFKQNIENAKKAGLNIGVYYYSSAVSKEEAETEADFVLSLLDEYEKDLSLPVVFDFEGDKRGRQSVAAFMMLGKEECNKICEAFCEKIKDAGYDPMVYTNRYVLENCLNSKKLEDKYKIWLAQYPENGEAIGYDGKLFGWQYSSEVVIDGISTDVDASYIFEKEDKKEEEKTDDIKKEESETITQIEETSGSEVVTIDKNTEKKTVESVEKIEEETTDTENIDIKEIEEDKEQIIIAPSVKNGPVIKGKSGREKAENKEVIAKYNLPKDVSEEIPVESDKNEAIIKITDSDGFIHNYRSYKAKEDNSYAVIASLLTGFFSDETKITPNYVKRKAVPAVFGDKYNGKDDITMAGVQKMLEALNIKSKYYKKAGDSVFLDIKKNLIKGKPVLLSLSADSNKWGKGKKKLVLLVGLDEDGKAIMLDDEDYDWAGDDQRVKLVSVTELMKYVKDTKNSKSFSSKTDDGGYIIIDRYKKNLEK